MRINGLSRGTSTLTWFEPETYWLPLSHRACPSCEWTRGIHPLHLCCEMSCSDTSQLTLEVLMFRPWLSNYSQYIIPINTCTVLDRKQDRQRCLCYNNNYIKATFQYVIIMILNLIFSSSIFRGRGADQVFKTPVLVLRCWKIHRVILCMARAKIASVQLKGTH